MKQVNNFNDFLVDLILEDEQKKFHGVTELPFIISEDLENLLKSISHPIASKLRHTARQKTDKKVTLVDLDEKDFNKVTLINSNKSYDNFSEFFKKKDSELTDEELKKKIMKAMKTFPTLNNSFKNTEWFTKNRASIRLGAFINKVFPKEFKQGGEPGKDIESFVQSVVAKRKFKDNPIDSFKIVKGEDIQKYYHYSMNDTHDTHGDSVGGPLDGSCMRHDNCKDFVNFYAQNKDVSMLVLFSDDDRRKEKIVGRALLWELSTPSGRTFMDRIYYRYESDMAAFKQHAESKGWLYKQGQNMEAGEQIVDTKTGESKHLTLKTLSTFDTTQYYPYMDTMKWFDVNGKFLTNNENDITSNEVYFLESTRGGYSDMSEEDHEGQTYVDYYGEWIDDDDLVYCEFGDEHRTMDDSIYCEFYDRDATQQYVDSNMIYSEWENSYILSDDTVHSDVLDEYISEDNAVPIYRGSDGSYEDIYEKDDVTHINDNESTIAYRGTDNKVYHFDLEEKYNFVPIFNRFGSTQSKHKVWDKDNIFKIDGKWYFEKDSKKRDKMIGQKRLFDD